MTQETKMGAKPPKESRHYVNNKKMFTELVKFKSAVEDAEREGGIRPRIPEYIGECFWLIANRYSLKHNFINYPFREDMVGDAIENCVSAIDNFDPAKSTNPFGYFSLIILRAFLRRIQKEKKQLYIKHKATEAYVINNAHLIDQEQDGRPTGSAGAEKNLANPYMSELVRNFEAKEEENRQKRQGKRVDDAEQASLDD